MGQIIELYGVDVMESADWEQITAAQHCPYLDRTCIKIRKSTPDITIGSCVVSYGRNEKAVMICPFRLLERRQIFLDCIHLLSLHEPGNELHIVPEVTIPGGSVDYFLVSVRHGKIRDFVGIELQTLDTTGTVWSTRQTFLQEKGIDIDPGSFDASKNFGMNWKMTAKTILVQLNHKVATFEGINKHLVLVIQDHLMTYMQREFQFAHVTNAKIGNSAHFHVYALEKSAETHQIDLANRYSTDADGIAKCLGLKSDPNVEIETLITLLESKLSSQTRFEL